MSAQSIERPGQRIEETTLAQLLDLDESSEVAIEWQQHMREIEESERSAENESVSVRIR